MTVERSVVLGADFSEDGEQNIEHADGAGYYIRGGIVVGPKNGVIKPGVVV